jgi:photosystem II stability/assembly factor-like uncharacterized protein
LPVRLEGVFFLKGSMTGWVVGQSGYIARTDDGGRTWARQHVGDVPAKVADAGTDWVPIGRAYAGELSTIQAAPSTRQSGAANNPPIQQVAPSQVATQSTSSASTPQGLSNAAAPGGAATATAAGTGGAVEAGKRLPPEAATSSDTARVTEALKAKRLPIEKVTPPAAPPVDPAFANLNAITFVDAQHGVAVGVLGTVLATEDGGRTWQARTSGIEAGLDSVHFADAQRGVAVGEKGTVLATEDGGRTWQARTSGTQAMLTSVHFANARHGLAVGNDGTVLATEDGGRSWQARTSGTWPLLMSVDFTDARHGIAVGYGGTVLATEDAGRTWQARTSGTWTWLDSVHFADAQHGVAVGEKGTTLTTEDGGRSWQARTSGTQADLRSVDFADAQHGVAVGNDGIVLATEDAGRTWQARTSGIEAGLNSVHFADAQHGVAVGLRGTVLATEDGGRAWQARTTGTQAALTSVHFANAQQGVAVGLGGTVLATEDGGRTWQARTSGTQSLLISVHFADAQRGVAVGEKGTVLATEDGGRTWQARTSGTQAMLTSVQFADAQHGVTLGQGVQLRTDDAGRSWIAATYAWAPAPWYWLLCIGLLGLLRPAGRIPEPEIRRETPQRTVADEYVSDRPARSASEDRLGFGPRVDGLSRYLRNAKTEPPLTLAITGAWGSGKSSFMRQLQEDLEYHGARSVWFNAWHHQKEEHLQAALLEAVRQQAVPPVSSRAGLEFRAKLVWERIKRAPIPAAMGLAIFAGAATYLFLEPQGGAPTQGHKLMQAVSCIVDPPKGRSDADKLSTAVDRLAAAGERLAVGKTAGAAADIKDIPSPEQSGGPAGAAHDNLNREHECKQILGTKPTEGWGSAFWGFLRHGELGAALLVLLLGSMPVVKGFLALRAFGVDPAVLKATLGDDASRRVLRQQTSFRQRFSEEFDTVSEALRPAVVTIFIDDLDRCSEQQVMEVLEAVNYLVESGRCFVVLGMVEETVQRLVGLAFERVAAELAEQEQHGASDGEAAEERKREQRKRFAERYLEKLINLRVEVPALDARSAALLVSTDADAATVSVLSLPRWVRWADRPLGWLCRGWLVLALMTTTIGAAWLGQELSKRDDSSMAENPAATAPGAQVVAPVKDVSARTPPQGKSTLAEQTQRTVVALPERLAPTRPERTWWNWLTILPGALLLAGLFATLVRRREYHTHDSPAFIDAFRVWAPLVMAKVKTPRGLKRFQNRVRFLAMALDAQAKPESPMPAVAGPLGRWMVQRELARAEAEHRFNALLPEPILVGLGALHTVEPELLNHPELDAWVPFSADDTRSEPWEKLLPGVHLQHQKIIDDGKWPMECRWPPDQQAIDRFRAALGLLPLSNSGATQAGN